jgi:hypothetical protein
MMSIPEQWILLYWRMNLLHQYCSEHLSRLWIVSLDDTHGLGTTETEHTSIEREEAFHVQRADL